MRLVSTAAQCRALDRQAIEEWGIPGPALMEVACRAFVDRLLPKLGPCDRVVVLCGPGNNGGDGYGIARMLHTIDVDVAVWSLSKTSNGDAAVQRETAARVGVATCTTAANASIVVDALFGTGLTRRLSVEAQHMLDDARNSGAVVWAVDLPSGVHADTGERLGDPLVADHTVSFAREKLAFFTSAASLCGAIETVDIGVHPTQQSIARVTSSESVRAWWPTRSRFGHKSGHLAVVAGSVPMAGAAILTCRAALRAGAGLVTLFTPSAAVPRLSHLLPAVMVVPTSSTQEGLEQLERFDAVAIGPGLGGGKPLSNAARAALGAWLQTNPLAVLDADVLQPDIRMGARCVQTPHPGEAGRLLGVSAVEAERDRFGTLRSLGKGTLLKGASTLVHGASTIWVNPTGSSVLSTAGSGDVLTGVVGALLARGVPGEHALASAAFVHGRAGELLERRCAFGHTASDIADAIPVALQEMGCA